jgi:hypothetical protein
MAESNGGETDDNDPNPKGDYDKHKTLVHVGYSAGGTMLTAVATYIFLWPISHLTALLVFAGWVSIIAIVEGVVWAVARKGIAAMVVGSFIAAGIAYLVFGPILPPPDVEIIGTLQPGNDPEPLPKCQQDTAPEAWRVMIGLSSAQFNETPLQMTILMIGQCRVFTVRHDETGVAITAELYDDDGNQIATIGSDGAGASNVFHALHGSNIHVDRKHDLSTLVVVKGDAEELLYVRYMNRKTVSVRGRFGCPGHSPVVVTAGEPIPGFMFAKGGECLNVLKGARFSGSVFAVDPPKPGAKE